MSFWKLSFQSLYNMSEINLAFDIVLLDASSLLKNDTSTFHSIPQLQNDRLDLK